MVRILGRYFEDQKIFDIEIDFVNQTDESIDTFIWPSTYLNSYIMDLIELIPRKTDWILCPMYYGDNIIQYGKRKGQKRDEIDDFQIGITGKFTKSEIPFEAIKRELGEELGLTASKFKYVDTIEKKKGKELYRYIMDIEDLYTVQDKDNNKNFKKGKDDYTRQIACIVHGTLNSLIKYIETPYINRYKDTDGIIGFVILPANATKLIYQYVIPETKFRLYTRERLRENIAIFVEESKNDDNNVLVRIMRSNDFEYKLKRTKWLR